MSRPIKGISQQLSPHAKTVVKIAIDSAHYQYSKVIIKTISHTKHTIYNNIFETAKSNSDSDSDVLP